jgi:hypothetical protein
VSKRHSADFDELHSSESIFMMTPHQTSHLVTKNIEDIHLGQRVVGRNPLRQETQSPSEIDLASHSF